MAESQNVEYKVSWRDEYLKWVCGFANAQGGTIYIGIDDAGNVAGVQNAKKLLEDIPNKIQSGLGIVADVNKHTKDGKDYLVYHALTNDLICKHAIPDGEGNSVTLPKAEKALSIEEELLLDYKDHPVAKEFFTKLRKRSPRYVYPQCNRIRRMQKFYTEEQIVDGFEFCVAEDICSVKELTAFLLCRYGEETARKFVSTYSYRHYKDRADEIREEVLKWQR